MSDFILPEPIKEQITSTPGTFDVLPPPQEQVFTEAEKASSVINQIKQMPDPSEGIARLYASKHLADRLGKTMSEVFRDFDAATAQYYGEIRPPKDWLKAIGDEMKIQAGVMKMGRLGAEAAHAKTPEEFAEKWEEYTATKRSLPDPDTISRSFPVEMTKQTLGLVSQMLSTIPESWDVGLAAGAGGAGVAALVGGPVLTTAGLMYVAGSAGKTEYGNAFMEMLESGVDFDVAKAASYGPGIVNGLIEAGQYAVLVKGLRAIPGVSPILDKAISKTLQSAWVTKAFTNKAVQFAGKVIGSTAGEVAQELAQESTTMAFTALAKYFQNESRGTNLPQATIEEVTERLLEIGKTSAMGFAGLSLVSTGIGSIRSGFKAKKAETKQEKAQAPEGAKIPEKEAPTPTGRPREQVQAEYDEAFRVLETNPNDVAAIDKLTELSIELETTETAAAPRVDITDEQWLSRRRAEATEAATTEERNTLETFKARIQENVPGMDNPQDLEIVSFAAKKFADSVGVDPDSFLDAALVPGVVGPELEGRGVAQGAVAGAQFVKVNDKIKMALRFTEGANGSSVVHELSHAYINFLRENSATPEVSRVLQEIEKSFGIEGGNWDAEAPGWTEAYQGSNRSFWEYYSYSLEDYIQTGQAPNAELKSIFDRIIQWLKEVYRDLSRRTEVSPEVQQYFDRLFSAEERTLYQSDLYHGTAHSFEKFSTQYMGTGEGHQAFGWGLYFTSNKKIAEYYAKLTTDDANYNKTRSALIEAGLTEKNYYFEEILSEIYPDDFREGHLPEQTLKVKEVMREEHLRGRKNWEASGEGQDLKYSEEERRKQRDFLDTNWKEAEAALDKLYESGFSLDPVPPRNIYKVSTNKGKPETWLDWNKELREQPEILSRLGMEKSVIERYEKILKELNELDNTNKLDTDNWRNLVEEAREIRMRNLYRGIPVLDSTGEQFYNDLARTLRTSVAPGDKEASLLLKSLGIAGNRFPAASMGRGDGSAGYNYVVFDEAAIEIEERILFQERAQMSAIPEVRDEQGRLLAPNGKPSNLNEFQWKQVRTPAFLRWFGDWINDPANASKVVDENGEPLVVYHGTGTGFDVFDDKHESAGAQYGKGFASFSSNKDFSQYFAERSSSNGRIMGVFLSMQNPFTVTEDHYSENVIEFSKANGEREHIFSQEWKNKFISHKKLSGYDGLIITNRKEGGYDGMPMVYSGFSEYIALSPTQIKSATANIGTFDPGNPSILYQTTDNPELIKFANQAYKEGLVPDGWYVHGNTRSVAGLNNDGFVVLMSKDWNVAKQYSGRTGTMYMIKPGDGSEVFDARNEKNRITIARELIEDYRDDSLSPDLSAVIEFGLLEYQDQETGRLVFKDISEVTEDDVYRFIDELNPKNIVDSAGLWDNTEFVNWFTNKHPDIDFIETDDGAVTWDSANNISVLVNAGGVLYQESDPDADLIREDVEATRWVPDSILERYRSTEWGKAEIERRDDYRREAAEFEDEAEFVSFQMTMDPEATPAQREYYQRIYESRESVSAEPIVSREDANRRFLDSLDKPGLEALISNLIGQNFDDMGQVFKVMDHKLFSSAVKTVRGGGHLSDGHYKRLMDQIRYDVTGFRDAVLVAAGDQDEYAQFIKEVITDKTAEELEQRKRELSALKREIDKKTTTIESLTRDIERERFYSKNMDTKVKALDEALKSAQAEAPMATREAEKKYIDALSSARKEAKAQATRAKKDAEKRIRDLYETRAKVTKLIKLIVKPPSKAMHWKEQKRLLQLQSTYITGLSKTQKEHRARLASILERVTEPDLIAKIKAELGIRNLKEMTIEELENLATQVQGIRRNGIDMRKLKLLDEKIRFHADKDKILEALEPLMKEQIQGRMSKEGKKAARTKLLKNIGLKALTPERVMEMFQGKTEGPFKELFIDLINEATDQQIRNEMERQKKLEAALERNNLKLADMGKTVKLYDFTYTRQDIMGFYLQMQNEESKAALLGGDRITEAQAREFIGNLTQEEKRFADELSEIVGGDEEFNRLEESIGENRNELMGRVERYFPMLRQNPGATAGIDQQVAAEILERKGLSRGGVRHGWSKSRIKISLENQKPIRHDSINVAFQQITAQERYIATQPALKRLAKIVNDSTVQDAMIRSHGYEAVQWMQKYIGDLANPDIYNDTVSRTSRFLRNNAATAYLAFNALTILKQFPSVLYYLGDVGPHHLIHAAGQFFHNPAALIREVKAMDPQVARRSIDRVFEELRQIDLNAWEKAIKKIGTVGMRGIALMDMVAVTIGWKAVYNAELAKTGDPGKAIQKAQSVTMRTQPSARVQNLPELYRTNAELNWLLMFTNQLNKIFNMVVWDIPMAAKEGNYLKGIGYITAIMMSGVAMGAISRRRPPDEPAEVAEDVIAQVLNAVPVVGGSIVAGLSGWGDTGVNPFPVVQPAFKTIADIFDDEKDMEKVIDGIGRTLLEGMVLTGLPQVATKRMYKTFIDELGDFQFNPWELIGGEPKE